ncbi:MAG: hypothetical protein V4682_02445 [Patescibacteria group bacterium]
MTRLFDLPDPNPAKLLELGIAQAMPLWIEGLDEKTKAVWIHTRRWDRTGPNLPLELVALVMAQVSLELFEEPGETEQPDVEGVRDYAGDYLHRVVRHGDFASNVRTLGDKIAREHSLCITIHADVQGGQWYVLSPPASVESELLRFMQDPMLARFAEHFRERYPVVVGLLRHATDWEKTITEILQGISDKYIAALEGERSTA